MQYQIAILSLNLLRIRDFTRVFTTYYGVVFK